MADGLLPDGWYPDPVGRYDERYVEAGQWMTLVRSNGQTGHEAFPAGFVPAPVSPQQAGTSGVPAGASKMTTTQGCFIWMVAVVGGLILIGVIFGGSSEEEERRIGAILACQEFVEDRLRAPASADFQSTEEATTTNVENRWRIESYVDSQNGFGAQLRTTFTCSVTFNADTDTWTLNGLDGLG